MRKEELQRGNGSVCVSPSVIVINNDMLTDWSLQTQRKEGGSPPDCISHGPLYQRVHRWQMGRDTAPAGETLIRCDNISHTHTRVLASQQNKPYQPWVCGQIWELFCMKCKASTWDFAGTKAERSQVRCRSCFSKYAEEKQGFNAPCKDTPMIT